MTVLHWLGVLGGDDLEMLGAVGQVAGGLVVEVCEKCTEARLHHPDWEWAKHNVVLCAHHRDMLAGSDPRWTLLASRCVWLPERVTERVEEEDMEC